ncbi:unnamed protein product, partial [marine sediment metagenome]
GAKHSCSLFDTDTNALVLDKEGKAIKSLSRAQSLNLISVLHKASKKVKTAAGKAGGDLATVLQPSKGAIVFALGEHKISLNPQHLYDAYLYYEDMMLRESVDEEFSLVIKDCVKVAWERLNHCRDEGRRASITMEGQQNGRN